MANENVDYLADPRREHRREYMREWYRKNKASVLKRAADPKYLARRRECDRKRYAADPECRTREQEYMHAYYRKRLLDPEYRARINKYNADKRERRAADPNYRALQLERDRKRRADPNYRLIRRKRRADPNYRALQLERDRKRQAAKRMKRYSITVEQYNAMLTAQQGVCAICKNPCPTGRKLAVDHDHSCCPTQGKSCGKCVRGLLCCICNKGLGSFRDSPVVLYSAIEYIMGYADR